MFLFNTHIQITIRRQETQTSYADVFIMYAVIVANISNSIRIKTQEDGYQS